LEHAFLERAEESPRDRELHFLRRMEPAIRGAALLYDGNGFLAWQTTWQGPGTPFLAGFATYAAVCVAWVFFRASDFTVAARMLRGMFGGHTHGAAILTTREMLQIGLVTAGMIVVHWTLRDSNIETAVMRSPRWIVAAAWALMACAIILTQGNSNAFIYFQF
jgi:alginate O-acetyltransferase complex protein AlgI